jgi:hypothetical protein
MWVSQNAGQTYKPVRHICYPKPYNPSVLLITLVACGCGSAATQDRPTRW